MAHRAGCEGGACVITLLKRPSFYKEGGADGRTRLGYNAACEARSITQADVDRVKSRKHYSRYADANL